MIAKMDVLLKGVIMPDLNDADYPNAEFEVKAQKMIFSVGVAGAMYRQLPNTTTCALTCTFLWTAATGNVITDSYKGLAVLGAAGAYGLAKDLGYVQPRPF
jgi:hypothetical protein